MKMNYYYAITALIQFKDRHQYIQTKKNEIVLKYLHSIELRDDYESEEVPDVSQISKATNLPRAKIHPILYEAYNDIIQSLYDKPHTIPKCVHVIYISIPYDERSRKNKGRDVQPDESSFWGEFKLPTIPRMGETINLNFIDWNSGSKYRRGVVVDIEHEVSANEQRVIISVHPFKNYYSQWEKLKQEHLNRERWLKELEMRSEQLEAEKNVKVRK